MKKTSSFILLLLFICNLFMNNVYADIGAPWSFFGNVIVSNEEGAVCHRRTFNGGDQKSVIPYGEVLEPGEMYGNEIEVTYNGKSGFVDYHDVKPLEEYYYPENIDFENNYVEKVVLNDVYALYKGPSLCYDKIDWIYIPKESTVRCVGDDYYWHYIEYEETRGWIYLNEISDEEGLTDTPLLANVINQTGWIYDNGFIEANIKYVYNLGRYNSYYVESNNYSGLVEAEKVWYDGNNQHVYVTSDALNIYSDAQCSEKIDCIKYDGVLKLIRYKNAYGLGAIRYDGAYIEYDDGKEGFVNCMEDVVAIWNKDSSDKYPINNEDGICYLYNKPIKSKENVISEISEGSRINYQYEYCYDDRSTAWYHVNDGEYNGWVCSYELYDDAKEEYEEQEEEKEEIIDLAKEDITTDKEKAESYNVFDVIGYVLIFILFILTLICYFNKDVIKQFVNKKRNS